jgi:hypothetical protein
MPGLLPGIHVLFSGRGKDVDGRDEPGHDAEDGKRPLVLRCHEANDHAARFSPEIDARDVRNPLLHLRGQHELCREHIQPGPRQRACRPSLHPAYAQREPDHARSQQDRAQVPVRGAVHPPVLDRFRHRIQPAIGLSPLARRQGHRCRRVSDEVVQLAGRGRSRRHDAQAIRDRLYRLSVQ